MNKKVLQNKKQLIKVLKFKFNPLTWKKELVKVNKLTEEDKYILEKEMECLTNKSISRHRYGWTKENEQRYNEILLLYGLKPIN